ncbi:hypothetical protein GLOIN_2v1883277 [Rhizophagus irregularis DAOM 181602=DAOM 197198]|nr:hypothetical protein GLOIN_2v1883277 [Rhizophagus irregularis DAOM 181602=DAOM 197198]
MTQPLKQGLKDSGERYSPQNDQDLCKMLRLFITITASSLLYSLRPFKPFNEWIFLKMCELYGLSDNPNPSIDVYSVFSCGCANTKNKKHYINLDSSCNNSYLHTL